MHNLTRRDFLRHGTVAVAGLALTSCDSPTTPDDTPGALGAGRPKRVAVIGAGLSGLVAAFELSESKWKRGFSDGKKMRFRSITARELEQWN